MKQEDIKAEYLNSVKLYKELGKKEEKLIMILSVSRFITFVGGFIIIWIGFTRNITLGLVFSFGLIILFLYLLKQFLFHSEKKDFLGNLVKINQNEADALSGKISAFDSGNSYIDIKHDFSFDVDLFGSASLFQYLNRTVTDYGRDILAGWLSDPFSLSPEMPERQEVIKELASKDRWRHKFMASGMKTPLTKNEISDLTRWLEEDAVMTSSFKKILINVLPAITMLSLLLVLTGILPYQVFVFFLLLNLLYVTSGLKITNRIHNSLSRKYSYLSSMNALLGTFQSESFKSPVLNEIGMNISGEKTSAAVSVKKLGKLIQFFDSRNNMITGFLLNGLLLWDYQCLSRIEKWKSENKNMFPLWLRMIGQADAFISLGNYAFNNPGFAYPGISDMDVFSAKNLGHQLIDERKRICNDFSHGEKGIICIISGANMAGKSTFLRTVAVNYILAMAGAPVCASEMKFIPSKLFTSMRTMDSLSDNESYFYAELRRLNLLKKRIEEGVPVFFILDEILKGTNSADKSTGSRLFLQRLIERGGTGLLATHDTSLGPMESEYPSVIINKCFEIEIDGENIRFDYKIQNGITQKMNAVFLMKQMGILD
jgi:ABC-type multidrug transport system fused ATPase/permease subunit